MRYCSTCGKKIDDFAKFCWSCGNAVDSSCDTEKNLQTTGNNPSPTNKNIGLASNTIKGIGIALTFIGLICGILITIFMSTNGEAFDYDSWNYYYGGGRETSIGVAVFSGASLLIGICMLIGSLVSNNENKPTIKTQTTSVGFKKCSYCGKLSPIETERCLCGCSAFETNNKCAVNETYAKNIEKPYKCDMCDCESDKATYAKIIDEMGTRYRNLCDKCMRDYKATPVEK